ncbi:bifunctional adenosylcobinamide kinase/adenosylcobinamide-phosphate guanylyltransferase [hot springs metagenome]|uniref:Adenosylcobinamide kinase n=1 Tax=hot springs metagenome TaxID=433727 RepID=A0A5J4L132_9ZZZZ
MITFIIGGTRSGKSKFAMEFAENYIYSECTSHIENKPQRAIKKSYIATARALDDEMKERIERHKRERPAGWDTYEEPLKITSLLKEIHERYDVILIDCLTLWLSNMLLSEEKFRVQDSGLNEEIENFILTLKEYKNPSALIIVSNEVGMGIVPENELARRFRDMAGLLNQKVAEIADEVYFVVSGIPVKIKG